MSDAEAGIPVSLLLSHGFKQNSVDIEFKFALYTGIILLYLLKCHYSRKVIASGWLSE